MRYIDIKDHCRNSTHNLGEVPMGLLEDFLGKYWGPLCFVDMWALREKELPRMECIKHSYTIRGWDSYDTVCSILVDGIPALLFIVSATGKYKHYVLDAGACESLIRYIVDMLVSDALVNVQVPQVGIEDDIPELTKFCGEVILYGATYSTDNPDGMLVRLNER